MSISCKPLQDYILVKPITRSRSETLIVITAETDQGSIGERAEIVAVGPGTRTKRNVLVPLAPKVGEICYYGGERLGCINFPQVKLNGIAHKLIQQADIIFIED